MTVLDKLTRANFLLSFDKHPCKDLDFESKTYYLIGLVLAIGDDGVMGKDDREYLLLLNSTFGFEDDKIDEYTDFVRNASSHEIKEMIQIFDTKTIKYCFMMDCLILAGKNNNFDKEKEAIVEYYFNLMKIPSSESEDLKYLAQKFQEKDDEALGHYFKKKAHIEKSLFEYLIDYYSIDLSLEIEKEEAMKSMQHILNIKKNAESPNELQYNNDILKRIKCIKYDKTNQVMCNGMRMIPLFVHYSSRNRKKSINIELGDLNDNRNQIYLTDVYSTDNPKDIRRSFHNNLKKHTIFNSFVITKSLKKNQIDYFLIYVYDIDNSITGYIDTKETKAVSRRIYNVINNANLMDKLLKSVKKHKLM